MVISIIALLVALLLPSLAAARKAARIAVCGSQLRQNGVAMNAYQVDNGGYYPLFGGAVLTSPDPYGRIVDVGDGSNDGWCPWRFDQTIFNNFGTYLNLPSNTTVTPYTSTSAIKYCPVVDWNQNGAYSFIRPDGYGIAYASGMPGYNYYTGRIMNGSTWANGNTIRRRDNPREILVTDQLMQSTQSEDWSGVYGTIVSPSFSWFNPHYDRSCTSVPQGSANELASDGHVVNVAFKGSIFLQAWYAIAYFEGSWAGNPANPYDSTLDPPNGPGIASDTYAITP